MLQTGKYSQALLHNRNQNYTKQQPIAHPEYTADEVKRCVGCKYIDRAVRADVLALYKKLEQLKNYLQKTPFMLVRHKALPSISQTCKFCISSLTWFQGVAVE